MEKDVIIITLSEDGTAEIYDPSTSHKFAMKPWPHGFVHERTVGRSRFSIEFLSCVERPPKGAVV